MESSQIRETFLRLTSPDNHRVLDHPPIPFTADDLRGALRSAAGTSVSAPRERALINELSKPGGYWDADIVMLVALQSPDHASRAARYLHMSPQMLDERLKALCERLDAT